MISLLLLLTITTSQQPSLDFDTQLIHKLCEITRAPTPTKIEIEYLSADKMIDIYRKDFYGQCLRSGRDPVTCAMIIASTQTFVFGVWEEEKDPLYIHIRMYKSGGLRVLVHEFLHWRLGILSEPRGILNDEGAVDILTTRILISDEFQKWLKEMEK